MDILFNVGELNWSKGFENNDGNRILMGRPKTL
jgi:hypothetical protein